jgi:hypothetical protein
MYYLSGGSSKMRDNIRMFINYESLTLIDADLQCIIIENRMVRDTLVRFGTRDSIVYSIRGFVKHIFYMLSISLDKEPLQLLKIIFGDDIRRNNLYKKALISKKKKKLEITTEELYEVSDVIPIDCMCINAQELSATLIK